MRLIAEDTVIQGFRQPIRRRLLVLLLNRHTSTIKQPFFHPL